MRIKISLDKMINALLYFKVNIDEIPRVMREENFNDEEIKIAVDKIRDIWYSGIPMGVKKLKRRR